MKSLKFSDSNARKLILAGKIRDTWRIGSAKKINRGDTIQLCDAKGKEFCRARVTSPKKYIKFDGTIRAVVA